MSDRPRVIIKRHSWLVPILSPEERLNVSRRRWYQKNRDSELERFRKYHKENREKIIARRKLYREKKRVVLNEYDRKYCSANAARREYLRLKQIEYRAKRKAGVANTTHP